MWASRSGRGVKRESDPKKKRSVFRTDRSFDVDRRCRRPQLSDFGPERIARAPQVLRGRRAPVRRLLAYLACSLLHTEVAPRHFDSPPDCSGWAEGICDKSVNATTCRKKTGVGLGHTLKILVGSRAERCVFIVFHTLSRLSLPRSVKFTVTKERAAQGGLPALAIPHLRGAKHGKLRIGNNELCS